MISSRLIVKTFGQLAHYRIARKAQFSQNFSGGAHNFRQAFRPQHDERDRQYQYDFEQVQKVTPVPLSELTRRNDYKFHAASVCLIIIIPAWGVNDA
jgi:hypothetical protein